VDEMDSAGSLLGLVDEEAAHHHHHHQ